MSILLNVLKVLRGEELDANHKKQLMHEALLLTLARAASSDSYVEAIEVSTIQRALKEAIGVEVSEEDVRSAAESEIFEAVSLETALQRLSGLLSEDDRMVVVNKLAEVIRSDSHVNQFELDYFDRVVQALRVRPSMLIGLAPLAATGVD